MTSAVTPVNSNQPAQTPLGAGRLRGKGRGGNGSTRGVETPTAPPPSTETWVFVDTKYMYTVQQILARVSAKPEGSEEYVPTFVRTSERGERVLTTMTEVEGYAPVISGHSIISRSQSTRSSLCVWT